MGLIWAAFAGLVLFAGWRVRQKLHAGRGGVPVVDDAAVKQILDEGSLAANAEDERLDLHAAAEAEEEFWDEYWDEPEEY